MAEGDHYSGARCEPTDRGGVLYRKETTDWEKFEKWAATVPTPCGTRCTTGHLELKLLFGVDKLLNPSTAKEIYDECTTKLRTPEYSARLMKKFRVEVVCTTDDPIDSLQHHISS